jgi:hypothetical protein
MRRRTRIRRARFDGACVVRTVSNRLQAASLPWRCVIDAMTRRILSPGARIAARSCSSSRKKSRLGWEYETAAAPSLTPN